MADFVVVENPFLWVAAAALIVLVYLAASWINKSCFSVLPVGEDSPLKGDPNQHLKVFSPGGEYLGIAASASPFCSKLESYCRMAGIPYSRHSPNIRTAPKGKMPYIEHDGNRFGDSTLIIRYFEQSFFAADGAKAGTTVLGAGARMLRDAAGEEGGKSWTSASGTKYASGPSDPTLPAMLRDSELEPLDLGIATAATVLAEEGLNQRLTMSRWWEPANWHIVYNRFLAGIPEPLRTCIAPVVRRGVWDALWSKGLIRHSPADNLRLVEGQLQALEGLLGAGKARWEGAEDAHPGVWFLLGSRPCAADACLLGMMDNFLNDGMDKPENTLTTPHALPLVNEYVGRLRAAYFPDQAAASPTGPSGHSGSAAPLL